MDDNSNMTLLGEDLPGTQMSFRECFVGSISCHKLIGHWTATHCKFCISVVSCTSDGPKNKQLDGLCQPTYEAGHDMPYIYSTPCLVMPIA
jgi:hypothetical protein